ncbi:helix-turn-helix transcriptional regulator [Vibrio lentus]|uniref:helix-turn-helix transcriptional regulator n=1 Tax=Vibrio lentus TaxID=136468 RepID=UPI000C85059F|nr:helix-turn-helix transcriptional regulator [Vibrio lentus]PMG99714.1 DNA-binding protein [Vibrio lentus]
MQISENTIPLDNGLHKSPSEFEEKIREGLIEIGVEHVTLVIMSKNKNPIFKYIQGLSGRISISKRVTEKLESYLSSLSKDKKGQLCHSLDTTIENRIFDHEELSIVKSGLNNYSIFDELSYDYEIFIIFHSVNTLKQDDIRQLELICDITIAWANSWIAHHTMLLHWNRYSEPKTNHLAPTLTKSETDVLDLIIRGLTGSEVAQIRSVSKETVRTQIKSILHKTQCKNQNQLISRFGQGQWLMTQTARSTYT